MSHELEMNEEGEASFVWRKQGGAPWHRLGTPVSGHQTAETILPMAGADYQVTLLPVQYTTPDGVLMDMEDRHITARVNDDGGVVPFEVVKDRYRVVQNETVLEKALNVCGASKGDAIMDTCGVLKDGREFFATIDLGTLIIDPIGINDEIARYLVVHTSHDGTTPITYANTDIRAVCKNTVRFGQTTARSIVTARHTANYDRALEEANEVLRISTNWAKSFKDTAERLLAVPVPAGSYKIDKVLNGLWPEKDADTDRKKENRSNTLMTVRGLYVNRKNAAGYGYNGWSLFNAVGEFYDHHWFDDADRNAKAAMQIGNKSYNMKTRAADLILDLV
jgi:phage/plasmid-like protein (TIGR03299 family)